MKARLLHLLAPAMGYACAAIGIVHWALGIRSVPGEAAAGATVDSRERFYGAMFTGYGLAWLWAVRQSPVSPKLVRWLAGIFLLGGLGRVVSLAEHGRPQWFQLVLTGVEVGLPPVLLWAADAERRTVRRPSDRAPAR